MKYVTIKSILFWPKAPNKANFIFNKKNINMQPNYCARPLKLEIKNICILKTIIVNNIFLYF